MAQAAWLDDLMTIDAFLDWERHQDVRHELIDGVPVAMAGGTVAHNTIVGNIGSNLKNAFRKQGEKCGAFAENMKVITPSGRVTYPDGVVDCAEDRKLSDTVLKNPTVIFEVFSEESEKDDRGAKWVAYRAIPTLQHYVMLSQVKPLVEMYTRDPHGGWHLDEFEGIDAVLDFPVIATGLALEDIYQDALVPEVLSSYGGR